jgi:hypothetical protein
MTRKTMKSHTAMMSLMMMTAGASEQISSLSGIVSLLKVRVCP